eukprot:m.109523 g.109523  ORF g.109523 m.109523 type:complete len:451 (+) comp14004_c0_seq2:262-1614(+)
MGDQLTASPVSSKRKSGRIGSEDLNTLLVNEVSKTQQLKEEKGRPGSLQNDSENESEGYQREAHELLNAAVLDGLKHLVRSTEENGNGETDMWIKTWNALDITNLHAVSLCNAMVDLHETGGYESRLLVATFTPQLILLHLECVSANVTELRNASDAVLTSLYNSMERAPFRAVSVNYPSPYHKTAGRASSMGAADSSVALFSLDSPTVSPTPIQQVSSSIRPHVLEALLQNYNRNLKSLRQLVSDESQPVCQVLTNYSKCITKLCATNSEDKRLELSPKLLFEMAVGAHTCFFNSSQEKAAREAMEHVRIRSEEDHALVAIMGSTAGLRSIQNIETNSRTLTSGLPRWSPWTICAAKNTPKEPSKNNSSSSLRSSEGKRLSRKLTNDSGDADDSMRYLVVGQEPVEGAVKSEPSMEPNFSENTDNTSTGTQDDAALDEDGTRDDRCSIT